MNATNTDTTRQFNAIAPSVLKVGRRSYKRKGGLFEDATNTTRFDFVGRKQRGAFITDKVTVSVTYQAGADLYDVTVTHFDGVTFDTTDLVKVEGVTFDFFADVAAHVA